MEENLEVYTKEDIYKAFDIGLESAVFVLERSIELPVEDQV